MKFAKTMLALILSSAGAHAAVTGKTFVPAVEHVGQNTIQMQAETLIREQIAQRSRRHASDFEVRVEQLSFLPAIEKDERDVEILSVMGLGSQGSQRLDGLFVVDVVVKSSRGVQDKKISGILKVTGPVVVARNSINGGSLITADSVEELRLPWKNFPAGASYTPAEELIGRKAKAFIAKGGFVFSNIVEEMESVRAGDWVNLTLVSSSGVLIRSKAISKQPGAVGESIRVENPDTKKILTGIVVGNQEVEVQL